MPTVKRVGPYRLDFYTHEPNEPRHVHVDRESRSAKFWLNPVRLARNFGFTASELTRLLDLVENHQNELVEAWDEYFGAGS